MKHTKGPWRLEKAHDDYILLHKNIWFMNLVGRWYPSEEQRLEYEANARLIAAAPDLLQRLEDARDAIASLDEGALGSGTTEVMGHEERWPIRGELLDYISKAIRKAKGEHEPN